MGGSIASGERLKERYRLERMLGRGGMAAVWLGHDEVLDRPVAVKVLADTIASDPGFVVRFRREARTAARLQHPNLADVYDLSEEGERPYLVMQLVPGEDLAARLERGERFDCDQLAAELLDALAHIHAVGILHRDVKPANVIVEPDGTAKLIDFGIALPADATSLTRTGMVLGTERYSAPEVLRGGTATERSDLFSLGVLLRGCEGERSRTLEVLIAALCAEDPRERPLSAAQALDQLEGPRFVDEPATEAFEPPFRDPEPTETLPPRAGGDRRKLLAGLLAGLALVVVVAALALSGGGDSGREEGGGQRVAQSKGAKGDGQPPAAAAAQPATEEQAAETEPEPEPEPEAAAPSESSQPAEPSGSGAALNEQGYALIQAGEPEAAVPLLEEAVAAFPEGTDDINYAYALYNLGNALRLSGRAAEAIPILERRLEIPDQRVAVREELEAARAEAGA